MRILGAYLLLALLMTWPLPLHVRSACPGSDSFAGVSVSADTWNQVWSLWWTDYAMTHRGGEESLYATKHIFYPTGTTLALHTLFPLYGFVAFPVARILGVPAAWNILVWLVLAVAGWTTYVFCLRWTGAKAPSFLAGAAFAFSPYVMAHLAAGHLNLAGTLWFPLYFLCFLPALGVRPHDELPDEELPDDELPDSALPAGALRRRLQAAALAGLVLLATAYADFYYLAFLLLASAFALIYLLLFRRELLFRRTTGLALALEGGIFIAGFSPLLHVIRQALRGPPFLPVRGYGYAAADLLSYVVPSHLNSFVGGALTPAIARMTHLPQEWTLYPGLVVILLAVLGFRGGRPRGAGRFFGALALVFFILSLGIYLKVGGRSEFAVAGHAVRIPLPFLALSQVPGLSNLRSSGRFGVVTLFFLAPLAASGLALWRERLRPNPKARSLVLAGASLVLVAEYVALPFPLMNARVPPLYREIAGEAGTSALLEVPFGVRDGSTTVGREESRFQLYQTVHQRPILSGCVSRMREEIPRAVGGEPVLRNLIRLEQVGGLTREEVEFDMRYGASRMRELGVKYVLIHPAVSAGGGDVPWGDLPGPAAAQRGPDENARRYLAMAEYLKNVLRPVEVRTTAEGIIVLRLF